MQVIQQWRSWTRTGIIGCPLAAGVAALTSVGLTLAGLTPAALTPVASAAVVALRGSPSAVTGPVSPDPAQGTPQLARTDVVEQVRQLAECDGTMYAVGTFTEIEWGGKTYLRRNVFSFSATSPYRVTSWNPDTNGEVNSIALTPDCSHAWLGGNFTKVGGRAVANIAKVSTSTGSVVAGWAHWASSPVDTVLYTPNGHVLVGGKFTSINGSGNSYYASLNPSTGRDDGYLNLNISGTYAYPDAGPNYTQVYNQQLSPDGRHVLAEGVFTSVQGRSRQQIFMLNLARNHGNVSDWYSGEFDQYCVSHHPSYIKAAAWSPDMSTVYVADTGEHLDTWNRNYPLTGLCDAVAAFPATRQGGLVHEWINYTGCDSLYSATADASTVYVGGHERWADNPDGCNSPGTGAIPAPGLGGFTPGGSLLTNASATQGRYSRARGYGADDLLRTAAGLWIASDNFDGSVTCGGVRGHAGICFLPNS
jgi:hypothetical protein